MGFLETRAECLYSLSSGQGFHPSIYLCKWDVISPNANRDNS
jgi:hypothetical protein